MTKKITCTLPNASDEISGVPFVESDGCMLAEGVADEIAAQFLGIPGYHVEDDASPSSAADSKAAAKAATKAAKLEADQKAADEAAAAASAPTAGSASTEDQK